MIYLVFSGWLLLGGGGVWWWWQHQTTKSGAKSTNRAPQATTLSKRHRLTAAQGGALLTGGLFFLWYFATDGSLFESCLHLTYQAPFANPILTATVVLAVWGTFAATALLCLRPFFPFALLNHYAQTFCLGVGLLDAILLRPLVYSFTGSNQLSWCGIFLAAEVAWLVVQSTATVWQAGGWHLSKTAWCQMWRWLPGVLLFAVPPYLFSTLFGHLPGTVKGFALPHRLYLYLAAGLLFGLYFLWHRPHVTDPGRHQEATRAALLYIALVTLFTYCQGYDFKDFLHPSAWPLHLCNTAMFIIPICLIWRCDQLFYFTFFINVFGALLAMLIPNYSASYGLTSPNVVHFWTNHLIAFVLPLLIVFLGVYRRPRWREFCYSLGGFLAYFLLVLFLNAYFTSSGQPTDFFFINTDFVAAKLGLWAENLRQVTTVLKIGSHSLVFYPLYQALFFGVYVALSFVMWFIYGWLFQVQDFYDTLSAKRGIIKVETKTWGAHVQTESLNQLVVTNVTKQYGAKAPFALAGVSLRVQGGEIFGFLGPNGAGKSTLIKCIVGIQPPTSGSITINGYDIVKQPVLAKQQFGFVPDHYALYEKLTGREYLNYIADLYAVSATDRDTRLNQLLHQLNLQTAIDRPLRTYSHGMKQKIAIMSALIHQPKLWILDEPLTGLDPNSIHEVKACMKAHAAAGNIVFFSSHIIDIVEKLCDRIMIIKNGQIIAETTLAALQQQNIALEDYYLNLINPPLTAPESDDAPL